MASVVASVMVDGRHHALIDLRAAFGPALDRMPWVIRILAENVLRHAAIAEMEDFTPAFLGWLGHGRSETEIAFRPSRILMHDTTCVPALVDIAGMRDALAEAGLDPALLRPAIPIDVSVDHSVAVDRYGTPNALGANMAIELERNAERYRLMKWATIALPGLRVNPPGTGIMHTLNLEQLATVSRTAEIGDRPWVFPDTLIGTDSHTPMINGIGVLGWGVGGLEAEGVMLGMPVMLRLPEVVGVRLVGSLPEGVLSTDLALAVTQRLRAHGVTGEFVEFFGPGVSTLSAGDRAVVANMAPEYGATTGFFPVDERTIDYLRTTGRPSSVVERAEVATRRQGLWFDPDAVPTYTATVDLDLSTLAPSLAGPRRPQDLLSPRDARASVEAAIARPLAEGSLHGTTTPDGAVAIAAITSCTNTTDPRLLLAAGLVARKARALGIRPAPWVKTSLAPGSPAAERYLRRAGLLDDLASIGFDIVGFGCTTCIGNSGPLPVAVEDALDKGGTAVAVLSGNRNFPGRVHPRLDLGFLASPPMVIAYALAGDIVKDVTKDPLARTAGGTPVFLSDLWPTSAEIDRACANAIDLADFPEAFAEAAASRAWRELDAPTGKRFPWDDASTYIRRPPFTKGAGRTRLGSYTAVPLLVLGDDITTDHISPAGKIMPGSEAAQHLVEEGEDPSDLNVFASRRGNFEAMVRGLFDNRSVSNALVAELRGARTLHAASGTRVSLREAAELYEAEGTSVVIVAGERYGMGSSRDWAAKGVALLGVRAVIASSFERIHRTNLIAMGVLPLELPAGSHPSSLGLSAKATIEIDVPLDRLSPRTGVPIRIVRADGSVLCVDAVAAVETGLEVSQLAAGGIVPLILDRLGASASDDRQRGLAASPTLTPRPDNLMSAALRGIDR
ncbi:aconitate hydratase AcnA [Fulvimarina sp. 2208YS6-2-32]|uniref:Aconitate hydratase n=1 Tax=Fulvimarina uroteuthidis TaxID=3098149 RepID=A0ABU5I4L3_9HYPH|nr:aconitate hydratase AcnA [Fulvimarina sp. 2208YS6-2-32]MDY8109878.1 aconitate hydratase AcnA [Fulvimarina sp. 2208YS6-2-32]